MFIVPADVSNGSDETQNRCFSLKTHQKPPQLLPFTHKIPLETTRPSQKGHTTFDGFSTLPSENDDMGGG